MDEDIKSDVEMYFQQIIALLDLMIETNSLGPCNVNLFTLRDIAEKGFSRVQLLEVM